MQETYNDAKEALHGDLARAKTVSLTTDTWTSIRCTSHVMFQNLLLFLTLASKKVTFRLSEKAEDARKQAQAEIVAFKKKTRRKGVAASVGATYCRTEYVRWWIVKLMFKEARHRQLQNSDCSD